MTVKDAIVGFEMDNALFSSGRNNDAVIERNNMAISALKQQTCGGWIPCSEMFPDCEVEVCVTTRRKYSDGTYRYIITSAFYEDGTMPEDESEWSWNDCDFEKYDEENDCYIVDEGWWEYKHYNPDDVYNNAVEDEVIAWQPLPEPYKAN